VTLPVNTLQALAEGVAQQLAALADSAQHITWQSSGSYAAGTVGIYMASVPTTPDKIVTLSPRELTAHPTLVDAEYALQIRTRGTPDPRVVWALRDACRDVILGRWPTTLPNGLEIRSVDYAGGGAIGQDASLRWMWSDNFTYQLGEHRARPF
jgi:hypothetical protein